MATPFGLGDKNILGSVRKLYAIEHQWPVTIWDLNHADPTLKQLKDTIGDAGTAREHSGTASYKVTLGASPNKVSIFNPIIMGLIFKFYPPEPGAVVYDPFGGGGTRALMSVAYGYKYIGVELRKEEVDAVEARIAGYMDKAGYMSGTWDIKHGDSRHVPSIPDEHADMLITCPPYYDMEPYDGGVNDLSMAATYDQFLDMLGEVVDECYRILKPGAMACWVIGLHRKKDGVLLPMHHDLGYLHLYRGFDIYEEVIIHMQNTGSVQRVGNFAKGDNRLIRIHEYLLIFKKRR